MNAVSAFLPSGFQIQTAQFLGNRNEQTEQLTYQEPTQDDGVVRISDALVSESETSDLEPHLLDLYF